MRKWTIPLAFIGLGGAGALLYSLLSRGLKRGGEKAPARLAAWNDATRRELDRIQESLQKVEQSLHTHSAS